MHWTQDLDRFHLDLPGGDDPYWNESGWFSFNVPERRICGWITFHHRPNMKLSASAVALWDEHGEHSYDCLFYENDPYQALPADASMHSFALREGTGLCIEPKDPGRCYDISYQGDGCELRLTWEAFMDAIPITHAEQDEAKRLAASNDSSVVNVALATLGAFHYEQFGRVRGTVVLEGSTIEIDSWSIRDRSWGPRLGGAPAPKPRRGNYGFAVADEDNYFVSWATSTLAPDSDPIVETVEPVNYGFYCLDGVLANLVSGEHRVTERGGDDQRPLRLVIDAVDELGRELHAEGRTENFLGWHSYTFNWWSLGNWQFNGQSGWGEISDYYTPAADEEAPTRFEGLKMPTDPLHMQSPPSIMWTTVNTQEALPGVPTPLGWTFWDNSMERALRAGLFDLGILSRREREYPPPADGPASPFHQRGGAVFFGRVAVNLTFLRAMADRLPGTSGDALELQLLGGISPGAVSTPTRRRYPTIAVRAPLAGLLLPHRLRRFKVQFHSWWQAKVHERQPDAAGLGERLLDASAHYEGALRLHCSSTRFLAQGAWEQLRLLAEEAGEPGLELTIASGYGTVEETQAAVALWDVAHNRMSLEAFLLEHGFHGPDEGEISNRVWREDPRPVQILAEKYGAKADGVDPREALQERVARRVAAEERLMSRLSPLARRKARIVLPIARRYIPLVEVTKGALVRSIDVGRAAARAAGVELADRGLLNEPDDIFYLTVDELVSGISADVTDRIAFRRERRAEYLTLEVPERWTGQPEATSRTPDTAEGDRLTGIAASGGVVEGRARVVQDASAADTVGDGEILVCQITDPSWVLAFTVAGGVVIDVGGVMSHGAIVAREMGLPCVINVRNGTSLIETGDLLRVDGTSGLVTILARQPV